jgi:hypothetical protein
LEPSAALPPIQEGEHENHEEDYEDDLAFFENFITESHDVSEPALKVSRRTPE